MLTATCDSLLKSYLQLERRWIVVCEGCQTVFESNSQEDAADLAQRHQGNPHKFVTPRRRGVGRRAVALELLLSPSVVNLDAVA